MEFLEKIWEALGTYLSIPYLLVFMFLAYLVKTYFLAMIQLVWPNFKMVFAVLILAAIIAVPFLIFTDEGFMKIIVSYSVGTSLHELLFGWIEDKFRK